MCFLGFFFFSPPYRQQDGNWRKLYSCFLLRLMRVVAQRHPFLLLSHSCLNLLSDQYLAHHLHLLVTQNQQTGSYISSPVC